MSPKVKNKDKQEQIIPTGFPELDKNLAGGIHSTDLVLLAYSTYTDLTYGDVKAPILCCSCDEVGCSCVKVGIDRPLGAVIWRNFESCRKSWKFGLKFQFEPEAYRDFMKRLRAAG